MKFLKLKLDRKVGRPPGDITYYGEEDKKETNIRLIQYNADHFSEKNIETIDELENIDQSVITWIKIEGFSDSEKIKDIAKYFDVHEMVIEDIFHTGHLPKYEEGDDYLIFVLKSFYSDNLDIISGHVTLFLKQNIILSFSDHTSHLLQSKIERIKLGRGRARKKGVDYLFFLLIDTYIDSYYYYFEDLREKTNALDETIMTNSNENHIHKIYDLKNELSDIRKNLFPLKSAINELLSDEPEMMEEDNNSFFNDCKDHINELIEYYHWFMELTNNLISLNENNLNNNTNRIMKLLTIIATIFIPLTFIAGLYGMNFEYMPELKWRYGYFVAIGVMLAIGIIILFIMRKKKWI